MVEKCIVDDSIVRFVVDEKFETNYLRFLLKKESQSPHKSILWHIKDEGYMNINFHQIVSFAEELNQYCKDKKVAFCTENDLAYATVRQFISFLAVNENSPIRKVFKNYDEAIEWLVS